jgi:hypothetical protein
VFVRVARLLAVCILPLLHLGFALGLNLGAFSPAMMCFFPLLLTRQHWDLAERWLLRRTAPQTQTRAQPHGPSDTSPSHRRWLSEVAVGAMMLAIASEIVNDNTSVPLFLRVAQPAWAKAVIEYPRLLQGWRMFAPDPPLTDSMIYVDATTAEGTHVDPYNAVASRQHFPAGDVVPVHMGQSQFFTMYSDRIANPGYAAYRQAFLEWLLAYPQRTGRPSDCLTAFDVYLVTDRSPLPGEHARPTPLSRERFMQYVAPADGDCRPTRSNANTQQSRTGSVSQTGGQASGS